MTPRLGWFAAHERDSQRSSGSVLTATAFVLFSAARRASALRSKIPYGAGHPQPCVPPVFEAANHSVGGGGAGPGHPRRPRDSSSPAGVRGADVECRPPPPMPARCRCDACPRRGPDGDLLRGRSRAWKARDHDPRARGHARLPPCRAVRDRGWGDPLAGLVQVSPEAVGAAAIAACVGTYLVSLAASRRAFARREL